MNTHSARKIFVLEDDAGIQEMLLFLLQVQGYDAAVFTTIKEFHTRLKTDLPDLFILDMTLPDGSGLDVSLLLKKHAETMHIPILLMSANTNSLLRASEAGLDQYISKPFDINEFIGKVQQLI